jgi:hypothetical protein
VDDISGTSFDAALQIHRDLGPGLLESVYEAVLARTSVGLLINFGAPTLREGLRRIVHGFQPSAYPRLRVNQGLAGERRH